MREGSNSGASQATPMQEYHRQQPGAIGLCDLLSLAGYLALATLFFGRALFEGLSSFVIGKTVDSGTYIWSLVWWPHAVAAGINPFIAKVVWAPLGVNLSWVAAIPLASFVAYPLTVSLGPVASYNLLVLLCPPLAAWSAFLLCRYISDSYWPSLLGGYIFGFSPYILHHIAIGHLNLLFVFPIPLAVCVVLLRLDDRITDTTFSAFLAGVLITQFLLATETFATLVVVGAIGILVFYAFAAHELRERIARLIKPVVIGLVLAVVLLAPYFYYTFVSGDPNKRVNSPAAFSVDVLNFFIPTAAVLMGSNHWLLRVSDTFTQSSEPTGYLCLPLLIVLIWFGYRRWGEPTARALVAFVIITCVLSIGPRLHLAGHVGPGMPWKLATHLPLLNSALPARFMIYAYLALAVVVSLLANTRNMSAPWKYAGSALIVLLMLPNSSNEYWERANASPEFFTSGVFKQYLTRNETVVVLPYGMTGNSMLWQAESDMYYRMAGGYVSANTPDAFVAWPITNYFLHRDAIPDAEDQLKAFLSTHDVHTVLVTDEAWPFWKALMSTLASSLQHAGGVYICRVPAEELARYRTLTAIEMETRFDSARFDALLIGAQQYLANGGELAKVTPFALQSLRLLPFGWVSERDIRTRSGLYVGPAADDGIAVGVTGSYEALKPTIERYRGYARGIYFPYPGKLSGPPRGNTFMRLLVIEFSRDGLANAAEAAKHASVISAK